MAAAGVVLLLACSSSPEGSTGADGSAEPTGATGTVEEDAPAAGETAGDVGGEVDADPAALLELDLCTLASAEEVGGIVGNPVGDGESLPLVCSWDSATVEDVAVSLGLIPSFGGEDPCADLGSEDSVEVSGLGEGAYWRFVEATGFNTGSLDICLGDLAVGVQLAGAGEEATLRSASEELLGLVTGRL